MNDQQGCPHLFNSWCLKCARAAESESPDVWGLVIHDMENRRALGLKRYAKPVMASDMREDWLQHAYEEALDTAVYLKAEIERRKEKGE